MTSQVIEIANIRPNCCRCDQVARCFPNGLGDDELTQFNGALKRRQVLQRGEHLFRQRDSFDTLYLLRAGTVKLYAVDANGVEQVMGFALPGDVLGLDAISGGYHHTSAVLLETGSVCQLSFSALERVTHDITTLQSRLNRLFSEAIVGDYRLLKLLAKTSAEQRLSQFLLQLSQRFAEHGYSADEFTLSMSRQDMSSYLGLAQETVSRVLGRLQRRGVLAVDRRQVKVLDRTRLAALAGEIETAPERGLAY